MQQHWIVLLALALIGIAGLIYFALHEANKWRNRYKLLRHRHVCEILEVEGFTPDLNFKRIPELWSDYSFRGEYDRFSFKESVVKKFTCKVNAFTSIDDAVSFCATFSETQRIRTVSEADKAMISDIYQKMCSNVETRVMLLAHQQYHKLYVLPKSKEKDDAMVRFGLLLDQACIKNFFPLSKTILDIESKELLQKAIQASAQKRKKLFTKAVVLEMKGEGSTSEPKAAQQ